MAKMRVGLVGYFGWGNFGDELFVDVYRQWLEPEFEVRVLHDLTERPYFSRPMPEVLADIDAVVIGGGDLIVPWSASQLYWRKAYLELPVFVCGVGVPTWKAGSDDAVAKMRAFVSHPSVRSVNARDDESAAWITTHLSPRVPVSSSADLVFALDLPAAPRPDGPPILGVAIRDRSGKDDDMTNVHALCAKAVALGYRVRQIVLATGQMGERDGGMAHALEVPGKEVIRAESTMELCRAIGECTAFASMKFHGTVVATAYGLPSFVLVATDKNRNLMRMIERPDLLSSFIDPRLPDRFSEFTPPVPAATREMLRGRAAGTMESLREALRATRRPAVRARADTGPAQAASVSAATRHRALIDRVGRKLRDNLPGRG